MIQLSTDIDLQIWIARASPVPTARAHAISGARAVI
jgi:hypothetical protein